jgi:hypothetical protein
MAWHGMACLAKVSVRVIERVMKVSSDSFFISVVSRVVKKRVEKYVQKFSCIIAPEVSFLFSNGCPGPNPTIVSYNATSSLVRFDNKKYFLRI